MMRYLSLCLFSLFLFNACKSKLGNSTNPVHSKASQKPRSSYDPPKLHHIQSIEAYCWCFSGEISFCTTWAAVDPLSLVKNENLLYKSDKKEVIEKFYSSFVKDYRAQITDTIPGTDARFVLAVKDSLEGLHTFTYYWDGICVDNKYVVKYPFKTIPELEHIFGLKASCSADAAK